MIRNKIYYSLPANNEQQPTITNLFAGNVAETFKTDGLKQPAYTPIYSLPANNEQLITVPNLFAGNRCEHMPINYLKRTVVYTEVNSAEPIVHPDAQIPV